MLNIFSHISELITLEKAYQKDGRLLEKGDLSIIKDGAVVFDKDVIHWVGATRDLPSQYQNLKAYPLQNCVLSPALVDSHTHLLFGGDRSEEYSMRLSGATYEQIATQGGGILFTKNATEKMNDHELFNLSLARINKIYSLGVKTIEIKSGYGLSYDLEKRFTLLIDRLKKHCRPNITIINTFMAAHAVPKEFSSSAHYLDEIVLPLLKELAALGVIDFVDIFHEKGYFSKEDVDKLFSLATSLGIKTKIHADEFNDNDGANIACQHQCVSADHLLSISNKGIKALAQGKTVATLLPGTGYFLGKKQAPAKKLIESGAKVSIASDFNPGSCHWPNLLQIAQLSAPHFQMPAEHLWCAITLNAAHSLGLHDRGAIVKGLKPIFTFFNTNSFEKIIYSWGENLVRDFDFEA